MHVPGWWRSVRAFGGFGLVLLPILPGCRRDAERARVQPPQHSAVAADTSAAGRLAAMDTGLREIEDGLRTAKRDRWDPAYVVERVGLDPAKLTAWVRDSTAWIPYRGLLRGPVGVLMDRDGNSLDRALLLAKLLELAGHEVRLARAQLEEKVAEERLPELVVRRQQLAGPSIAVPPAQATNVSLAWRTPDPSGTAARR